MCPATLESCSVSDKIKHNLAWTLAIPFQGGLKRKHVLMKICTWVFIATLFITIQTGNHSHVHQQMIGLKMDKILWYIHILAYKSAIKMKKLMIQYKWICWTKEVRQKRMPVVWSHIYKILWKRQIWSLVIKSWLVITWDQGSVGVNYTGTWGAFLHDVSEIFWLWYWLYES